MVLLAAPVCLITGCGGPISSGSGNYLVVEFNENQPLRYQFQAKREVVIELTGDKPGSSKASNETLDMIMTIRPVEVNPFGLTTLEYTCESAKVTRQSFTGRAGGSPDAMTALKGKTYTVQISPTGNIETNEDFVAMLRQIGAKSYVETQKQRVKNPDMIFDWMFFQLYLWDAVTSVDKPLDGLTVGDTWQSRQLIPWPIPIPNMPTRQVDYTLDDITETPEGRIAKIGSTYSVSDEPVTDFPHPYDGTFQIKGSLFSVLRNYQFQSLEGTGAQQFNLDTGTLLEDQEDYTLVARANFILPLGNSIPILTVKQSFSVKLLDSPKGETRAAQ